MNADDAPLEPEEARSLPEEPAKPTVSPRKRAAPYIDGFNPYHSFDDIKQTYLKLLNLAALARPLVTGRPEDVVRIVFCVAIRTHDPARITRHRAYLWAPRVRQCRGPKGPLLCGEAPLLLLRGNVDAHHPEEGGHQPVHCGH